MRFRFRIQVLRNSAPSRVRPGGLADIDVTVVRDGKNLKGRLLGFVLGTRVRCNLPWFFLRSCFALPVENLCCRSNRS